jgi:hypothetical protein
LNYAKALNTDWRKPSLVSGFTCRPWLSKVMASASAKSDGSGTVEEPVDSNTIEGFEQTNEDSSEVGQMIAKDPSRRTTANHRQSKTAF